MVFLLAMCAFHDLRNWKRLLILITAFTIGHSITLILAALEFIHVPVPIIEFLIPVTIFLTAISPFQKGNPINEDSGLYSLILFFGLIHGLGFSNQLVLLFGSESDILVPLFSFNLGIELGQILIVISILIIKTLIEFLPFIDKNKFRFWLSGMAAGIAVLLMIETKFW